MTTTFLGSITNSSPNGSAAWTLAAGGGGAGAGAFSRRGSIRPATWFRPVAGPAPPRGAGLGTADGLGAGEAAGRW
jgi:hypothetical protein